MAGAAEAIGLVLSRRLPKSLQRHAAPMAERLLLWMPGEYAPSPRRIAKELRLTPEFEKILRWCWRKDIWPDPDLTPATMQPAPAFARLDLPQIATESELADWLAIPPERLSYLADVNGRAEAAEETAINHYSYRLFARETGGRGLIEAPKPGLKGLQRRILRGILDHVPSHPDAFGFVAGRSCLGALDRHAGEAMVVCMDLRDFFGSIGYGRVFGLFRLLGYPHNVARALKRADHHPDTAWMLERLPAERHPHLRMPHLPQGGPASPALANAAAYTLDLRLAGLARRIGANYSRYADDLAFSGDAHITGPLLDAVPRIVAEEGFGCIRRRPG